MAACVALAATVAGIVGGGTGPTPLDTAIDAPLQDTLGPHTGLLNALAAVGTLIPVALMTAAVAAACLVARDSRGAILALLATPIASGLTEFVLKPLVNRTLNGALSYPSGHAASMFALAATAAIVLARRSRAALARAATVLALLLAAAVATAMVALNAHYMTDAIGGAATGTGVAFGCALALDRVKPRSGSGRSA